MSQEPESPGTAGVGPGGGGCYLNGPTDSRHNNTFIGWSEGGYNLKIGPQGASRFTGNGEAFGGGGVETIPLQSLTVSGSTVTATTATPHRLRADQPRLTLIAGCADDAFNDYVLATVTSPTTFTFPKPAGGGATPGGSPNMSRILFPDYGIISEALNGYFGSLNVSGATAYQILVRANGFVHRPLHDYIIAQSNKGVRIVQNYIQIGDPANGYNNIAGVDVLCPSLEEVYGWIVNYASSGGINNNIVVKGYKSATGYSYGITGTPSPLDSYSIAIYGRSPFFAESKSWDTWTDYTPNVNSSVGALGSFAVNAARYKRIGNTVDLHLAIAITANGTAGGTLQISLPAQTTAVGGGVLAGRDDLKTGKTLTGLIRGNTNTIDVTNYDFTYPAQTGSIIYLAGRYEV